MHIRLFISGSFLPVTIIREDHMVLLIAPSSAVTRTSLVDQNQQARLAKVQGTAVSIYQSTARGYVIAPVRQRRSWLDGEAPAFF